MMFGVKYRIHLQGLRVSQERNRKKLVEGERGRAISQAVSRWLLTAADRVRARSGHVGFVVDKVALWQVFS
jgi:hypothetical protein